MKYYITNFANLKKLTPNCIPISTAVWQPKFFKLGIASNGIMLGITERELSPYRLDMSDGCRKDCPYKKLVPNCPFLIKYREYLKTVGFNYIMSEFRRVAEDVRKATHYIGEPNIVLLVYEARDNLCSERIPLINWFKDHNIILEEWEVSFDKNKLFDKEI